MNFLEAANIEKVVAKYLNVRPSKRSAKFTYEWTLKLHKEMFGDVWRWAGMLAMVIVAGLVWTYRARLGPVYGLGIVLVAVVVFGPAIRPWYVVWGLVPLAAAAVHTRVRHVLAGSCAALVLMVLPDGFGADAERVLLAVLGSLLGIAAFLLVRLAVTAAPTLRVSR